MTDELRHIVCACHNTAWQVARVGNRHLRILCPLCGREFETELAGGQLRVWTQIPNPVGDLIHQTDEEFYKNKEKMGCKD